MNDFIRELRQGGQQISIIESNGQYTYGELADEIELCKAKLEKLNINPGSVIAILGDYGFKSIALFFALYELQHIVVPIASTLDRECQEKLREGQVEWKIILKDDSVIIEPTGVLAEHPYILSLRNQGDSGLILFSSGSTGAPKAMVHNLNRLVSSFELKNRRSMRILVFLMFDHIGGLNTLLNVLSMHGTLVLPGAREPEQVSQMIASHQVAVLPASPTFLNLLLMSGVHERYDLSSLRLITYGTEPMPEELLKRLRERFPKVKFLQTFGTSETGIAKTSSKSSTSLMIKIDDPNMEIQIVEGELWLRSRTQILGYMNASMESFTEDGWFRTGDLVELGESGYLQVKGRIKEVINVGGAKVLPTEIESVILEMAEVDDVLVYGEKNAITGSSVCADIVAHGSDTDNLAEKVRAHCRTRLDSYKVPTRVRLVERTNFSERFKKMRLGVV